MKIARTLLSLAFLAAGTAFAAEAPLLAFETRVPAATHPSLYSFADVYRLTVAGEPYAAQRWTESQTAASQAHLRLASRGAAPELSFAVSTPRDSQRWALALAGLAACAWVAHRRLSSPY
jgi:hypothetical protein